MHDRRKFIKRILAGGVAFGMGSGSVARENVRSNEGRGLYEGLQKAKMDVFGD